MIVIFLIIKWFKILPDTDLTAKSFCSWHLSGQRWPFEREICKFHFTSIVFRPGSISNFTKHIVCTHFPKPQWPPSKHGSCRAQIKKIYFYLLQNLWWETHHPSSTEECIQMSAYEKSIKNCILSCQHTPMQRLTCELLGQLIAVLHLFAFWGCCWNQEVFLGIFCDFEAKEVFFVRSFTRRVKNSAKSGGQRIKRGGCPFITRIHLDTWNNKTRGRASQRFPFGPWPFVAVNNLAKASVAAR